MSLPGKLCIGILEEDNPLKSYFRFKPLLVESEGRYAPCADHGAYPEEGCIRIVPDKNESYHFKARMRRIGLFCVVDLRAHPDSNDKIRPNKNYREGTGEQNAFIIYSDVVREPAPDMIFEIVPEGAPEASRPRPHTASVLMRGDALRPECYEWKPAADEALATLQPTDRLCPLERAQVFELEAFRGETVRFAILPPGDMERLSDAPVPRPARPAFPEREAAPERRDGEGTPAAQAAPVSPAVPAAPAAPVGPAAYAAPAAPAGPAAPTAPAQGDTPAEAPAAVPESAAAPEDKPWIHHDSSMLPKPPDPRLSPAQRSLAMQSGLNPRRGRSLQELIDEKWQHSRLNQLGQPVAPIQTGAPLASPVESAVRAVREVWEQPQLRGSLLESLGGIEEFGASLEECREAARQMDIERHLEELEARRLALLGELDHLNLKNAEVREALKRELRRDEAASLADAVERTKAARAEQQKYEALAAEARAAAQDARKAVEDMTGEALEQRLTDFALNEHMLERMKQLKGEAEAIPPAAPSVQLLDLNALAVRVVNRFDSAGFAITRAEALNLCACAAVSPVMILSGPVGSGKTETARMLCEALGLTGAGRCAGFAPGKGTLEGDARLEALERLPDTPAALLLDDANLYPAVDPLRGLAARLRPRWRLWLTVQDDGCPLSAHTLDRGFTVRLTPKPGTPWRPRPKIPCEPEALAFINAAASEAQVPAAAESRMETLREALGKRGAAPSRRALDEAWRYCALMCAALGEGADPIAVLDRAVCQRLLPPLLASAPTAALAALPALLEGLPLSKALLEQPLPVAIW